MMLIVGDVTWHAENVAFYIKRMHQLQKKVEQSILDLDKEARGTTPYGVTDKFGVEDLNLLEAIDRIAHADEEEMLTASEDYNGYMDKFRTHDRYSARRANLAHISLALEWNLADALDVLRCILEERSDKGEATTYYRLTDLEEATLEILDCCEMAYITSCSPVPALADLVGKLRAVLQRG